MAVETFENLLPDLEANLSPTVYVSTGTGAHIYHYSRDCLERHLTTGKVRRVPVKLVKWLGYAECGNNCSPDA